MDCVNMLALCNSSLTVAGQANITAVPVQSSVASDHTNALLYIVCVIMFYAFSIVVLMVKYVRREREEADQRNFFNEFIKREAFHTPQFQNKLLMQKLFSDRCMHHLDEHSDGEKGSVFDDENSETGQSSVPMTLSIV